MTDLLLGGGAEVRDRRMLGMVRGGGVNEEARRGAVPAAAAGRPSAEPAPVVVWHVERQLF